LHFKRQIQLTASNSGSARVAVELHMIGKGSRGSLLVRLFGRPWRVLSLCDEDRLRRILGAPSRAEEEIHVSVDWSRFPRLLPFAGTLKWLRGTLASPDIVNGHKDREGPPPS
jgi:hypothetical protein